MIFHRAGRVTNHHAPRAYITAARRYDRRGRYDLPQADLTDAGTARVLYPMTGIGTTVVSPFSRQESTARTVFSASTLSPAVSV